MITRLTNSELRDEKVISNVISKEKFKKETKIALNEIASILATTLGPYGSTSLIQDVNLDHTISKDGYSVLKRIIFKNSIHRTILDLVRNISQTQVRSVGDGSTSSVIVANSLYTDLFYSNKFDNVAQTEMIAILDYIQEYMEKELKSIATPITMENKLEVLTKIASVSTNNNKPLGKFIAECFNKVDNNAFIDIKMGKTNKHSFEIFSGFEVNRGLIDSVYLNQDDNKNCILKNTFTLHLEGKVNKNIMVEYIIPTLEYVTDVSEKNNNKDNYSVVIVANGYDHEVKENLRNICLSLKQTSVNLAAIDMSLASKESTDKFYDLAAFLNAKVIDIDRRHRNDKVPYSNDILGFCNEFKSSIVTNKSLFIEPTKENENSVLNRKNLIQDEIDTLVNSNAGKYDLDDTLRDLKRRKSSLDQQIGTIYVGGESPTERESIEYLIEDAVFACRSAIENGYLIGGNIMIPHILFSKTNEISDYIYKRLKEDFSTLLDIKDVVSILVAVASAFYNSFKTVVSNSTNDEELIEKICNDCVVSGKIYNLKNKKYESIKETDIINSSMTDIQIMVSCFSLIGLLGTSNQILLSSIPTKD